MSAGKAYATCRTGDALRREFTRWVYPGIAVWRRSTGMVTTVVGGGRRFAVRTATPAAWITLRHRHHRTKRTAFSSSSLDLLSAPATVAVTDVPPGLMRFAPPGT